MIRIIDELELWGVYDRGIPNKERVIIKIRSQVFMGTYMMFVGLPLGEQTVLPLFEHLFWFGNEIVDSSTWLFVYTGPGVRRLTTEAHTKEPALVLHWGKPQTIFTDPTIVPAIVNMEGVLVGPSMPKNLPDKKYLG